MSTTLGTEPSRYRYTPPTRLPSLSVVMPAHNEAENIQATILDALEAAASVADIYEVVVVDDGSTDATADIVADMALVYGKSVRLVRNEHNMGYGPTARRAWESSQMQWLLFTDSDGQFDLRDVERLVPLTDGADIVMGWRKNRQDPAWRKLNAHLFNLAGRGFFGTGVKDVDCAFKLMRTAALRSMDLTANSAMVNTELVYQARRHGLRIVEQPVSHREREFGQQSGGDRSVILRAVREFFVMRHRFNQSAQSKIKLHSWLVALVALIAGVGATLWTVAHGKVLAYGDAEAHLNIAKRVVDGFTPGFSQLGSVWLPLPHAAMVPFVANDTMWRSGIAGAIIGVPSLALLAVMSYRLAFLLTGRAAASWLAPAVLVANPNTLYLASTPMTEVLLLALVTTSIYFLAAWMTKDGMSNLILAGIFGSLASLSRYDGWMLVGMETVAVAIVGGVRHRTGRGVEGVVILFGSLAFSGVAGWLLWNQLIFNDPLYFAQSVYGSSEQQQFFLKSGLLPTYHDAAKSVVYWLEDVRLIAGSTPGVLATLGLVALVVRSVRERKLWPILLAGLALTSFAFYIISLYTGQASLILPRFAAKDSPYVTSNIRYGVQALLPIGLFVAYLASRRRVLVPLLGLIVIAQALVSVHAGQVMSYVDGTVGLSSQKQSKGPDSPPVEAWLRAHYDRGMVLMDDYRRPIGPVESGVPMQRFIGVGNKPFWLESLQDPAKYARWVVLQQADTDAVWSTMTRQSRAILADHFVQVFRSGNFYVFKKRAVTGAVVQKQGQHLFLQGARWTAAGVNSYDLLDQPQPLIDARLRSVVGSGANTVRTWCFDKDGGLSPRTLSRLAATLNTADRLNLKVVCTLANQLADYGGVSGFTPAGEHFFTSATAAARYREQVRRLLTYRGAHGRRIGDSNAILAWDLLNEPRSDGVEPVGAAKAWAESTSRYLGSVDQKHLITIGAEGFTDKYPANPALRASPGTDFAAMCAVPTITLCSGHLYPKYLSDPSGSTVSNVTDVLHEWRAQADSLNKPVLVGEAGYSLSDGGTDASRADFYQATAYASSNNDMDGALLWNLGERADSGFTLQFGDPGSERVIRDWVSTLK